MEDKRAMRYTISEMAELLGVTTHMLRHYEKVGIIRSETSEESGYRYYSVIDTRRLKKAHAYGDVRYDWHILISECVRNGINLTAS